MKTKQRKKLAPYLNYELSAVSFRFRDAILRSRFKAYIGRLPIDRVKACVVLAIKIAITPLLVRPLAFYGHHGTVASLHSWLHLAGVALFAFIFYDEIYPRRVETWWTTMIAKYVSIRRARVILRHAHIGFCPVLVTLGTYVRLSRPCYVGASLLESQYCRSARYPLVSVACIMCLVILVHQSTFPVEWGWHVLMWLLGWLPITVTHGVLVRVAPQNLTGMYTVIAIYAVTLTLQYLMFSHLIREFIGLSKAADADSETFAMNTDVTLPHQQVREAVSYEEMTSTFESSADDVNVAVRRLRYIVREKPLFAEGEE